LHDLAFTVSRSYEPGLECVALVASSHANLRAKLAKAREKLVDESCNRIHDRDGIYYSSERLGGKIAFLFPGENAQYPNMLSGLCLNFPEIREAFDELDAACATTGDDLLPSALNFSASGSEGAADIAGEMARWEKAASMVYTANTAMSRLLGALHIRPDAVVGHSFGEVSALEMAGVIRPGDGEGRIRFLRHAYLHLRELSYERDLPVGRLLTVGGAEHGQIEQIVARFPDALRVAMENCPHQYVLCSSGPRMDEVISEAERWLSGEGAICSLLPIGRPYHTSFFEPAFPLEKAYYEEVGVHPPQIEVYSCITTEPFPAEPEAIVEVAARHWMRCVRFQRTIEKMHERGFRVFIDVGPRGNLCAFVGDTLKGPHLAVAMNRAQRSDVVHVLNALGILAAQGVPLRIHHLHERWGSRVVDLRAGGGSGQRSMSVQLPTHIRTMKAEGIVVSRPQPAPRDHPAPATAPVPAPAAETLPGPADPAPPAPDEVAAVMLSYMNTMERFLEVQGELLGSLVRPGSGGGEVGEAPSRRFPLLGSIQEMVPGELLIARRTFTLQEDLYLKEHTLGGRVSTTDPSLRGLPVMGLAFSQEVAAEAAAALFPDRKVIAMVDTRLHRWIFLDQGSVTLRVIANRTQAEGSDAIVRVVLQQEDAGDPKLFPTMVEASVVLATAEPAPPRSGASSLHKATACNWAGADIYPRRTFHGPLFQGVRSISRFSDEGLDGTMSVLPRSGLIWNQAHPELEIDPLLLDSLGQAAWLWDSREPFAGRAYVKYAQSALRFYGPPRLPPGTPLQLKLRVRRREPLSLMVDLEAVDSEGNVRVAMEELAEREFPITPALHRMMLEPLNHHFADVRTLDLSLPGQGPARIALGAVLDFPHPLLEGSFGVWRKALAFLILSPPEREEWKGLKVPLRREIHWLLGRAAAKDALRHHFQESGGPRFASADLILGNDPSGRPVLAGAWRAELSEIPKISISHTDGMVVAAAAGLAEGAGLGVDAEKVRTPSQDLLDGAFSEAELALVPSGAGGAPSPRSEWVFRFWCAKEAVGKALGSGVSLDPRQFAVVRADAQGGVVAVRPQGGGEVAAATFRRDQHVFAVAVVEGGVAR
jgi:malonyl CoA-acyl carrier protein transacylase/phosphopantetheinyl transferase